MLLEILISFCYFLIMMFYNFSTTISELIFLSEQTRHTVFNYQTNSVPIEIN